LIDILTRTLLLISNALLVPVIIALFGMLLWTLLLGGGFIREWFERRKIVPLMARALVGLRQHRPFAQAWASLEAAPSGLPRRFFSYVAGGNADEDVVEQAISLLENDVAAALGRHSFITRISPILGLMGTLIPLGPALSGLAQGNIQALSGNLIVAFTATVIGLFISGLSYGMGLTRRIWYARDMTTLEFLASAIQSHPVVNNA